MLEVFDELGLRPKIIAGTSIGAVFGAAYASGLSAELIRAHAEEALSQRFDIVRQLLSARSEPVLKILNFLPIRSSLLKPGVAARAHAALGGARATSPTSRSRSRSWPPTTMPRSRRS